MQRFIQWIIGFFRKRKEVRQERKEIRIRKKRMHPILFSLDMHLRTMKPEGKQFGGIRKNQLKARKTGRGLKIV